jgi:hypothetical protein
VGFPDRRSFVVYAIASKLALAFRKACSHAFVRSPFVYVVFTGSFGSGGGSGCQPVVMTGLPRPAGKYWAVRYWSAISTRKRARAG